MSYLSDRAQCEGEREEYAMAAKDPVCGMTIEESDAAATAEYANRRYYFCSTVCKEQFERAPERYTSCTVPRRASHAHPASVAFCWHGAISDSVS